MKAQKKKKLQSLSWKILREITLIGAVFRKLSAKASKMRVKI